MTRELVVLLIIASALLGALMGLRRAVREEARDHAEADHLRADLADLRSASALGIHVDDLPPALRARRPGGAP